MAVDKQFFFATVRESLFKGSLTETQVATMDAIIDSFSGPFDQLAYILATSYHEVGSALEPVAENLNYSAKRITEVWPARFKTLASAKPYANNPEALGNRAYGGRLGNAANEGFRYRGRGFSQITGKANYAKFGKLMSIDLVENPDLALKPAVAARILVVGMERGLFTTRDLTDYVKPGGFDYVGARAIINDDGKTNGKKIAGYAAKFRAALREATAATGVPVTVAPTSSEPIPTPSTSKRPTNLIAVILAVVTGAVGAIGKALGWF